MNGARDQGDVWHISKPVKNDLHPTMKPVELVERALRNRVKFQQINLNAPLPPIGPFDFVFLRNVMIYFNQQTKRDVIARVQAFEPHIRATYLFAPVRAIRCRV